jgi:hypothetical protein
MKTYSVRISDALYADIQQEARKRGMSISAVARERITASSPVPTAAHRRPVRHSGKRKKTKRAR